MVFCVSTILIITMMLTFTFYYAKEYSKAERRKQVGIEYYECESSVCHDAAIELKDTLNLDKDPCKNFYEYVCSLWPNRYQIPDDMGLYSVKDTVREKERQRLIPLLIKGHLEDQRFTDERSAVRMFQSCRNLRNTDQVGVYGLREVLRSMDLGDWPYITGEKLPDAKTVVLKTSAHYGFAFVFALSVEPDPRNSRVNMLQVDLSNTLLHSNFLTSNHEEHSSLLKAYDQYFKHSLKAIQGSKAANSVFNDILTFETLMAQHSSHRTLRELTEFNEDNIVRLQDLKKGSVSGTSHQAKGLLARIIYDIYLKASVPLSAGEEVLVWNSSAIEALDAFFVDADKTRLLLNYVGWRVVETLGPATNQELLSYRHLFYQSKLGADDVPSLDVYCFEQVMALMPLAMGRMAFRSHADRSSVQTLVSRMVHEIKKSLLLLLERSDVSWLTDESKAVAIQKIRKVQLVQQPFNSTIIDPDTPDVLLEDSYYLNNLVIYLQAKAKAHWRTLGRLNYAGGVAVPQLRLSITYDVYRNAIIVPTLIARPTILTPELSPSINFGAFGYLVAHEMLRGIMFSGSMIDENGSLRKWYFRDTSAKFRILVNCFESMLRRTINNELMDRTINRELVIGSTALPAVFKAYRTFMAMYEGEAEFSSLPRVRFTQNQLFFLYFAKSWCHTKRKVYEPYYIEDTNEPPPDLRVNQILMDFEKFGKTFDCQLGTIMTPHFKCATW
ncbi:endothelin-converting enzyme-like 1 isoform X2 [Ornithodoros turicata]|uniref:endothelin-converting enzyme-like 1 isoform X2 n=1 Tax=Ornithodoros turicata TaxID=34597 RepID=UPI003138FFC8